MHMRAETATSLKRGLAILLALEGGAELGVSRVAEIVGREKSQVSRTLKAVSYTHLTLPTTPYV